MVREIPRTALAIVALLLCVAVPTLAQAPPDWMVGRFEGPTQTEGQTITLDIYADAPLTAARRQNGRNLVRILASFQRSILAINFRRIGDVDDKGNGRNNLDRLPDWFAGTYTGYDRRDRTTYIPRLDGKGALTLVVRGNDLVNHNRPVSFQRGVLTMDGHNYTIGRTSEGFRATPAERVDNGNLGGSGEIDFRHTGN